MFDWLRRKRLGSQGEDAAATFLRKSGVRILARNFTCPQGEIDLIGLHEATIVFFEVKTRRSSQAADPEANIGPVKQQQLTRVASAWLAKNRYPQTAYRFDAVAVIWPENGPPQVRWTMQAFVPKGPGPRPRRRR